MFISLPYTLRQRHVLSTAKPVCAPAMLSWATITAMSVFGLRIVRSQEMKQEVCPM